jgi:hypothetical protein
VDIIIVANTLILHIYTHIVNTDAHGWPDADASGQPSARIHLQRGTTPTHCKQSTKRKGGISSSYRCPRDIREGAMHKAHGPLILITRYIWIH